MVDCDVVLFKNPSIDCSVFVTNVPQTVRVEQLTSLFGKCGLVHEIHKFDPETLKRKADENAPTTCASVKYYTHVGAKRAIAEIHQYNLDGFALKVVPSKPMRDTHQRDLPFPKSVDVCNYFLGFHKWSTRVVAMRKVVSEGNETDTNTENKPVETSDPLSNEIKSENAPGEGEADKPVVKIEFECQVELKLDGKKVMGIGVGKHAGRFLPKVYEIARKLSITNARKNAFSKCALLVLTNGKVSVHADDEDERERQRLEEEEGETSPEAMLVSLNVPTIEDMEKAADTVSSM